MNNTEVYYALSQFDRTTDPTIQNILDFLCSVGALVELLVFYKLTKFYWLKYELDVLWAERFSGDVQIASSFAPPKTALLSTAAIAVLMFVIPPSNFTRGSITAFAGWKPLWELGYDPDSLKNYFIAFPILLAEWGLLLLCLFVFSVIRAPANKRSVEISHDAVNAPPEALVLPTLSDVQSKTDLPS